MVGIPGGPEMLVIGLIVILLFGANKIPQLAKSLGKAQVELKKGRSEVENELQDVEVEKEEEELQDRKNTEAEAQA